MNTIRKRLTLDEPVRHEITVSGQIEADWSDWVSVKIIATTTESGVAGSSITGRFDQAALHGVLRLFVAIMLIGSSMVTADPFHGVSDGDTWSHEKANVNLVADFINSLPGE